MPEIELLADLCTGPAGSIINVQDYESDVLVKLGVARLVDPVDPVNLGGLLLNLNGTPVVDDFGALVPDVVAPEAPKKTNKGRNKGG